MFSRHNIKNTGESIEYGYDTRIMNDTVHGSATVIPTANADNREVGRMIFHYHPKEKTIHIEAAYVAPEYRRRGIATILLHNGLLQLKKKNQLSGHITITLHAEATDDVPIEVLLHIYLDKWHFKMSDEVNRTCTLDIDIDTVR